MAKTSILKDLIKRRIEGLTTFEHEGHTFSVSALSQYASTEIAVQARTAAEEWMRKSGRPEWKETGVWDELLKQRIDTETSILMTLEILRGENGSALWENEEERTEWMQHIASDLALVAKTMGAFQKKTSEILQQTQNPNGTN